MSRDIYNTEGLEKQTGKEVLQVVQDNCFQGKGFVQDDECCGLEGIEKTISFLPINTTEQGSTIYSIDIERISPFFYNGNKKKFKGICDIKRIFDVIRKDKRDGMYRSYKNMAMVYHIGQIKDIYSPKEIKREIRDCIYYGCNFIPSLGLSTKTIKNLIGYYNTTRMKNNVAFLSKLTLGGSDRGKKFI